VQYISKSWNKILSAVLINEVLRGTVLLSDNHLQATRGEQATGEQWCLQANAVVHLWKGKK